MVDAMGLAKTIKDETVAAKVKQITGVDLPTYYNPTAINPLKFAEQIKKRKFWNIFSL